jgi:hypothetical protein
LKIDSTVEPLVREAFAGAVNKNGKRLEDAIAAIAGRGDDATTKALALALAVDNVALTLIHSGQRPPDAQLEYLAQRLAADAADWAPDVVTREKARSFLGSLVDPAPTALPWGEVAMLAFGTGGWLLAAFLPDDKDWTDFLDEIEDALESVEES